MELYLALLIARDERRHVAVKITNMNHQMAACLYEHRAVCWLG